MVLLNPNENYSLCIPTSRNEILLENLKALGDNVNIGDDRCLIALICAIPIKDLPYLGDKKINGKTVGVTPVFVKAGNTNYELIKNMNCGDTIVITRTALELGTHINIKGNDITNSKIASIIEHNDKLRLSIIRGTFFEEQGISRNSLAFTIDFKIINNVDIAAYYNDTVNNYPFRQTNDK
uniref:Uncharacterized protein n=1 Tax=Geladintestivirus 1 TaxID=3233133 RepID=A0AAU8MI85_9CAUD